MSSLAKFDSFYAEKNGDSIKFGNYLHEVELVIRLQPDGSIILDPDFVEQREDEKRLRVEWDRFVYRTGLFEALNTVHRPFAYNLLRAIPPVDVRTDQDRWQYVNRIAEGTAITRMGGPKFRAALARFISELAP